LQGFENEVAVADGVEGVVEEALEAEFLCHGGAVDVEGVSGEGAAAERGAVDAGCDFAEAFEFAGEAGGVREEPVGPADGLRFLEVCVAGDLSWLLASVHGVLGLLLGMDGRG
jgi:hypothetical protein